MRELSGSEANDDWEGLQGGFRADFGDGADTLTLQGDLFDNAIEESLGLSGYARGGNLLGRWNRRLGEDANLSVQAYYDRSERVARGIFTRLDTLDLHAQHTFTRGERHGLVWGGGYRRTEDEFRNFVNAFVLDPPSEEVSLADVFVQDQIALRPNLTLTAGLKLEHNSYTGLEYLPNLRLAWQSAAGALLWGSLSRVVRNPSRIERDLVIPGVLVGGRFQPEVLVAWEAGIRARPAENASVSVNVYLHEYDSLRSNESTPVTFLPVFVGNTLRGRTYGVEAWADYAVADWWRLGVGFTALGKDFERAPGSRDISGMEAVGFDPDYGAKLRSQMTLSDRLELDVRLRAFTESPAAPGIGYSGAPAYVAAEARLGWRVTDQLELSVTGLNLLDEHHREASEARAREVPRSVHAGLRWRY
jgi:iron complex outermembrane receptor protein